MQSKLLRCRTFGRATVTPPGVAPASEVPKSEQKCAGADRLVECPARCLGTRGPGAFCRSPRGPLVGVAASPRLGPVVIGRPAAGISREAREQFLAYAWPGNVRELKNAVERALILCEGGLINPEHLPWHAEPAKTAGWPSR